MPHTHTLTHTPTHTHTHNWSKLGESLYFEGQIDQLLIFQVTADLFGNENEETTPPEGHTHSDSEEDEEESDLSGDEGENEQSEEGSDNQEMPTTVSTDKRGTEMRLSGMVMSEGVGVGRCAAVRVTLQCTRCRAQQDETIRADK